MFALDVAQFPCHHPVVQATEGFGRYTDAEIIGPASDEGGEPFHDGADGLAREGTPFGT